MTPASGPRAAGGVWIRPVLGLPEIGQGADLAALLAERVPDLDDGDLVVVSSKVVSKAEGRVVAGLDRAAAVRSEAVRLVAARGQTRIVQTRHGFVMAAAGVDASNVAVGSLVLLPEDPDASARLLRRGLARRRGVRVGVVVTDTFGRPWRLGQTDLAVGAAGVCVLDSHQGRTDAYGNPLAVTAPALADELASAADLVKGKLRGVPAAVVRGLAHLVTDDDGPGVRQLVRAPEADLFRLGTQEAMRAAVRIAPDRPPAAPADPDDDPVAAMAALVTDLVAAVDRPAGCRLDTGVPTGQSGELTVTVALHPPADPRSPAALLAAGAAVERLRLALAVEGLASTWRDRGPAPADPPGVVGSLLVRRG